MTFKDIKENNVVYILDKNNLQVIKAKVKNSPIPKIDMNKPNLGLSNSSLVVDLDLEINGKVTQYTIPESLEVTYTSTGLVLATESSKLIPEVESMAKEAKETLAKEDYFKRVLEKSSSLLAELNPQLKERQETDRRLNLLEDKLSKVLTAVEKLTDQLNYVMDIYKIIKTYFKGKDPEPLMEIINILSKALNNLPEEDKELLSKKIYYLLNGGHYNEEFAKAAVAKMYYIEGKEKVYAPYWMQGEIEKLYDQVKNEIDDYNLWDFYVTMNMIMSDNYPLLIKRYPESSKDEKTNIILEDSINYLNDEDNPFGTEKIWGYLNAKL